MDSRANLRPPISGLVVLTLAASTSDALAQISSRSDANWPLIFGLLFFLIVIYPLPTWIAFFSRHPNRWIIFGLNLFLGGTGIVWFGCLIWASMKVHDPKDTGRSRGGESGLNIFANDVVRVKVESEAHPGEGSIRATDPSRSGPQHTLPPPAVTLTRIQRLRQLLDQGVIDDEQFERMRKS